MPGKTRGRRWLTRPQSFFDAPADLGGRHVRKLKLTRAPRTVLSVTSLEERVVPHVNTTYYYCLKCGPMLTDPVAVAPAPIDSNQSPVVSGGLGPYAPGADSGAGALPAAGITGVEQPIFTPLGDGPSGNLPSMVSTGPVRYADGTVDFSVTDIASDGFGAPFGQVRSWSNDPNYSSGANGTVGNGWVDSAFPALAQASGSNDLVVLSNGTTARYFQYSGGTYTERFFSQDVLTYDSGADQYVLTTPQGMSFRFQGFSDSLPAGEQGQFVSRTDPYGDVVRVTSYASNGQVAEVQRGGSSEGQSVLESWVYTYLGSGDPNAGLLASVVLRREPTSGGSWSTVREVDYAYYDGTDSNGNLGDLKTATVKDGSGNSLGTQYYRYYTGDTYDGSTFIGYQHGLKYYLSAASFDRLTGAGYSPLTATDAQLAPYADNHFEFNSDHRVSEEDVQGQGCSACSGGIGTYTFSYTASSFSANANYWAMKTVEGLPDGNENIVYTNAYGEVLLKAFHDTTANTYSDNYYQYNSSEQTVLAAAPSAVSSYDDTYANLNVTYGTGLIATFDYYTSTTATSTTAGGVAGSWKGFSYQQGASGTPVRQLDLAYYQITSGGVTINPLATRTVYRNDDGTGAETTTYTYTFFSGTTQVQSLTLTYPDISSSQNGPGTADTETGVADQYGRLEWYKDRGGFLHYYTYDTATGVVTDKIDDVDTTLTGEFTGLPTGWSTPTGGGLNLQSTYSVDALGRVTQYTSPASNVTYQIFDDVDHEVRVYAGWDATAHLPTGPTQVTRYDRVDSYSETLTMSATPHLNGSNLPDGTESISSVQTLSRSFLNAAGQLVTKDAYFNLTGLTYTTSPSLEPVMHY